MGKARKILVLAVGGFLLIMVVGMIIPAPPSSPPKQVDATPATRSQPVEPRKIGEWSGSGIKQTPTFETTKRQVHIGWTTKAQHQNISLFQIYVHRESDDFPVEVAANTAEEGKGENLIRLPPGKYYLKVNSTNQWAIVLMEE